MAARDPVYGGGPLPSINQYVLTVKVCFLLVSALAE